MRSSTLWAIQSSCCSRRVKIKNPFACAEALIENADPDALIGDKAYDADPFVDTLTQREIAPVIPPKSNRKVQRACDFALYCERNLIERFFNQLKHFRAIATRYPLTERGAPKGARPRAARYPL